MGHPKDILDLKKIIEECLTATVRETELDVEMSASLAFSRTGLLTRFAELRRNAEQGRQLAE